jgi:hypothetical protein
MNGPVLKAGPFIMSRLASHRSLSDIAVRHGGVFAGIH